VADINRNARPTSSESAVGRWILARLRHQRFFSLAALNAAIRALLDDAFHGRRPSD